MNFVRVHGAEERVFAAGAETDHMVDVPPMLALIAGVMVLFVFLVYLFFRRTVTAFTEGMRGER